jgi:hypothetical protein
MQQPYEDHSVFSDGIIGASYPRSYGVPLIRSRDGGNKEHLPLDPFLLSRHPHPPYYERNKPAVWMPSTLSLIQILHEALGLDVWAVLSAPPTDLEALYRAARDRCSSSEMEHARVLKQLAYLWLSQGLYASALPQSLATYESSERWQSPAHIARQVAEQLQRSVRMIPLTEWYAEDKWIRRYFATGHKGPYRLKTRTEE